MIHFFICFVNIPTRELSVAEIAQLGERETEDLKVPGSNPESSYELCIIPGLGNVFFSLFFFFVAKTVAEIICLFSQALDKH